MPEELTTFALKNGPGACQSYEISPYGQSQQLISSKQGNLSAASGFKSFLNKIARLWKLFRIRTMKQLQKNIHSEEIFNNYTDILAEEWNGVRAEQVLKSRKEMEDLMKSISKNKFFIHKGSKSYKLNLRGSVFKKHECRRCNAKTDSPEKGRKTGMAFFCNNCQTLLL